MTAPFDSVLVVSFGGPQGMDDIRPFLANVLRGRRVAPARVEEVAKHYEAFGGVSPITELTMRQARGLAVRLSREGLDLPVFVGMRNWKPFLTDTLCEMSAAGHRRAIGFITAAHRTYSSCGQYKQNVLDARKELCARGFADVDVTFTDDWHTHSGFVRANAERVMAARRELPTTLREEAQLVFTAHSIPVSMASASRYCEALAESARAVSEAVGMTDYALVFQSRSGRPEDPWLAPDVNDHLRAEAARGRKAVVVCPIGFVCDHVEVLHDLDFEAMRTAREVGVTMVRARAVNDAAPFIDTMADAVRRVWTRHLHHRVLPIALPVG